MYIKLRIKHFSSASLISAILAACGPSHQTSSVEKPSNGNPVKRSEGIHEYDHNSSSNKEYSDFFGSCDIPVNGLCFEDEYKINLFKPTQFLAKSPNPEWCKSNGFNFSEIKKCDRKEVIAICTETKKQDIIGKSFFSLIVGSMESTIKYFFRAPVTTAGAIQFCHNKSGKIEILDDTSGDAEESIRRPMSPEEKLRAKNELCRELGINPEGATDEEITSRYRREALSRHPDRNRSNTATEEMQRLNQLYNNYKAAQ
ncbi:MAG: J domain-containing protein [Bdellovibrionia bacterium]